MLSASSKQEAGMTIVTFVYGLVSYGVFFATFLYAIGFLGGFGVPLTVDGGGPESAPGVALGWVVLLISTFLINHFELFGLQQVWQNLRGQRTTEARFREPLFYKLVRHPLYVGWLMTFWATPTMTVGHLVFAAGASAYILIAIRFEERDLIRAHPEYAEYRRRVPMLIPGFPRTAPQAIAANRHGVASAPVERIGASQ
jgi:protein-S-isoprenylcysteine O-methyltransferase Ste14